MKRHYKIVAGFAVALALGAAAAVYAHPGAGMGPGFGPGAGAGMGPGMMMRGGFAGPMAGQQLMTPEERQAFVDKMRNAKTPEERQTLAQANHADMEKRAKEKGNTLPQPHGPGAGFGPNFAPPFAAPAQ